MTVRNALAIIAVLAVTLGVFTLVAPEAQARGSSWSGIDAPTILAGWSLD